MKKRQIALFLAYSMAATALTGCGSTEELKTAMSNMGSEKIDNMNTDVKSLSELLDKADQDTDEARKEWLDSVKAWTEEQHQENLGYTAMYEPDISSEDLENKCNGLKNKLQALKNTQDAYTTNEEHIHSFWTVYEPKEYIVQPSSSETIVTPATYKWVTEEEVLQKQKKTIIQPEVYETKTGFILPRETTKAHEAIYAEVYTAKPIKKHNKVTKTIHHDAEYTWQWVEPVPQTKTYKKGSKINVGDTIFDHYETPIWEETHIPAKTVQVTYPEYGTYTQEVAEEYNLVFDDDIYAKCYCGKIMKYECLDEHRTHFMIGGMFENMPMAVWNPEKNAAYEVDKSVVEGAHNGYMSFTSLNEEKSTLRTIIYWNYKKARDARTTNITTNPAHIEWNRLAQGKNVYRKATKADAKTFDKDTTVNWGMKSNGYWKKVQTRAAYDETITVCPEWTEYDTSRNLEDMQCEKRIAQYPFMETLTETLPDQDMIGTIRSVTQEEIAEYTDLPEEEWYYETVTYDNPRQVIDTPERTTIQFQDAVTEIRCEPKCWACSYPGCKETRTYDPENPLPPNDNNAEDNPEQPSEPGEENPDQTQANQVIETITNIGTVIFDAATKTRIDAARTAYDALTNAQKTLVTNYQNLLDAETAYAKLQEEHDLESKSDAEKAAWADNKIDAIGNVAFTPDCKTKITDARNAYDKLSESAKALCTRTEDLLNAEAIFKRMTDIAAGQVQTFTDYMENAPINNDISDCEYFFYNILDEAQNRSKVNDTTMNTYMVLLENTTNEALEQIEAEHSANIETYRKRIIGMVNGYIHEITKTTWSENKAQLLENRVLPNVYDEDLMNWVTQIEIYAIRTKDAALRNLCIGVRNDYPNETRLNDWYNQIISNLSGTGIGTLAVTNENQIVIESDPNISVK